jgi:hypothetical protein
LKHWNLKKWQNWQERKETHFLITSFVPPVLLERTTDVPDPSFGGGNAPNLN